MDQLWRNFRRFSLPAFLAAFSVAAHVHADTSLPDFLTDAMQICNDVDRSASETINDIHRADWINVPNSERILDMWTQGDLAKGFRNTADQRQILDGYAKWRRMAEEWVADRTEKAVPIDWVANQIGTWSVGPGSIGFLLQHPEWSGVLEVQLRWNNKNEPIDALSCLFVSEQPFFEEVLKIGPQLKAATVLFETETQVYSATTDTVNRHRGGEVDIERRLVRLTADHWVGVSSDVRVQSVLSIAFYQ